MTMREGTFNRTGLNDNQRRIREEDERIRLRLLCARERRTKIERQPPVELQEYLASLKD